MEEPIQKLVCINKANIDYFNEKYLNEWFIVSMLPNHNESSCWVLLQKRKLSLD